MGAFFVPKIRGHILVQPKNRRLVTEAALESFGGGLPQRMTEAEAVTKSAPFFRRGTLPGDVDIFSLRYASDTGFYTIGSANTNPNLPNQPGVPGELWVVSTGNATKMILTWRSRGGTYEIEATGATFSTPWRRTDRGNEETRSKVSTLETNVSALQDIATGAFYEKETLVDGTDVNSLTTRSSNGIHLFGSTQNYPNRPLGKGEPGVRTAGMLLNFSTGLGDTYQMVIYRNRNGVFERYQTGTNAFSDWEEPGTGGDAAPGITDLQNRVDLLEQVVNPETPFELTNVFTSYALGDTYMGWLARKYPTKVSILDLGNSREGLPIRAFQLGDPTKPTYYLMASQHGSEPMGREAALIWARELCADETPETASFLQNYCIVITPCVNVDRINVQRLSSSNTDLNRNWITKTTAEIQAASSVFTTHDVVLTLDAHEGGKWTAMQAGIVSAPEAAQSLKDASQGLYDAVAADFVAASENFETYPGDDVLEIARNAVAVQYKSASIVFEGASGLDADMYAPDVVWRRTVYLLAYRSVFDYLKTNMNDFVTAKTAAGA